MLLNDKTSAVKESGSIMSVENTEAMIFWHCAAWLHWLLMSNVFRDLKYVKNVEGRAPTTPLLDRLMSVTSSDEEGVHVMPYRGKLQQLRETNRLSSLFSPTLSTYESSRLK
jgi:hypothetical protein